MKSRSPKINPHPCWQRTVLNTAVIMAVTAFCAPTVFAGQCDVTISTAQTVPCEMNIPSTTTITHAGSIYVTAPIGTASTASIMVGALADTVSINNSGTISNSAGGNAIFVASNPGTNSIGDRISIAPRTTIINQAGGSIAAYNGRPSTSGAAIYFKGKFEGSLTNNGTIVASGSSNVAAICVSGNLTGSIVNTSSINAIALSAARDLATGIFVDGLTRGASITNSGTINATATTTSLTATSSATGIDGGDLSSGASIANTSSISAKAISNAGSSATGIDALSLFDADIVNSNSITAVANGLGSSVINAEAYVEAFGMDVSSLDGGSSLNNSGTIKVAVLGGGNMSARGMKAGSLSGMDSMLINSNTIKILAAASSLNTASQASAYGIQAGNLSDTAMVTNHGTILVTASAPAFVAGNVKAAGILSGNLVNGDIANTGTIVVSASGAARSEAYGIKVHSLDVDSTVSNSGTVEVIASSNYACAVCATSGSGLVSNTGRIYGSVALGGSVNMVNTGLLSIANAAGNDSFVGGNFSQGGNGVLRVSVTDVTNYTKLVAGSASLGANAQLSVFVPYSNGLTTGAVDNIVTAGSLNAPTGFTITDNSLAWQFTGVVEGNNIDLYATPTYLTTLSNVAAGTDKAGLASVLDNIIISNPNSDTAQALYGVTSVGTATEVMAVMQSYTPVLGGSATQSTLDILRTGATKVVYEHLQDAGGPYAGDSIPSEKAGWIKPYGSWAKQKDQPGSNGYQVDSYGLVGGRDWQISNQWRMGGALSYSASKMAATNGAQRVDMKTYQAGVYAKNYFNDTNVLNLQFDLGWNKNESQRAVAGSFASANYGSRHMMASAELERTFRTGTKTSFIPSVRGEYFNLKGKTYAEQGSPLNLTVMGQSQKALIFSLGGTVAYKLDDEATLTANLNVGRDLKARQAQTTASFSNSPGATFVTSGVTPSANIVRAGLGYEIEKASGTTIVTRYDLDKKSSGYVNHLLSLNVKTLF